MKRFLFALCVLALAADSTGQFRRIPGLRLRIRPNEAVLAPCTTTISSGSNLNTSVGNLAAGGVLCLNAGTYSTGTTITSISKSPSVTVRPVTTSTAVTFSGLKFSGAVTGVHVDCHAAGTGTWCTANGVEFINSGTKTDLLVSGFSFTDYVHFFAICTNTYLEHFITNHLGTASIGTTQASIEFEVNGTAGSQGAIARLGTIDGGTADGCKFGTTPGGRCEDIYFVGIDEDDAIAGPCADCHTDSVQAFGGTHWEVVDSYFYNDQVGIAAYDGDGIGGPTTNLSITGNIVDIGMNTRPYSIELYKDSGSTIDHNTVVYRAVCGTDCGIIDLNTKDDPGSGTIVTNNIATQLDQSNGSTAGVFHHNLLKNGGTGIGGSNTTGSPTYTGGTNPTTVAGFVLNGGLGINGATDGSNIGAVPASVLALLRSVEPGPWSSPLQVLARWLDPPTPQMQPLFAVWKAKTALKYGQVAEARSWATLAQRLHRQGRGV